MFGGSNLVGHKRKSIDQARHGWLMAVAAVDS